jgi:carboxymethylenebutenolidase
MTEELLALPPGGGGPGILVLHAWWGLNDFMRQFCQQLASEGFVVLAPDLYHGKTAATIDEADELSSTLKQKQVCAEITSAAQRLSALEQVTRREIGLVGFSLGAFWALWLSVEQPSLVRATAVFYGARDLDYSPSQSAYLGHFAETDPYEAASSVKKLEKDLKRANRPAAIYTYPATGHWFFESDRPDAYDPQAAALAWQRTLAFFKEQLIT